jgi:Rrf2 family protein
MSQGVEWALHVLLALSWVEDDAPVPLARLAACYELPPAYLNKQLQSLVRAGLLESTPGAAGGFRLGRPARSITLMDVVSAIEGVQEAFRCTEIRQRGAGAEIAHSTFGAPCAIHSSMRRAELAWRRELAAQTIADLSSEVRQYAPAADSVTRRALGREPKPSG